MKEESKKAINWIKKQINLAKECCINPAHKDGYPEYEADYDKAMSFLDSLPDVEKMDKESFYLISFPYETDACLIDEYDRYLAKFGIKCVFVYRGFDMKKLPKKEKHELLEYIKKQIGIED